jgi:flagellar basal-body rod protein FlgC
MANPPLSGVADIIGSGLFSQSQRLSLIASNLANANSVTSAGGQPYRALEPVFEAVPDDGGGSDDADSASTVSLVGVVQSAASPHISYDPSSPFANQQGYVAGSDVSVSQQMVDLIDATQSYQDQIAVLAQHERLEQAMVQSFIA